MTSEEMHFLSNWLEVEVGQPHDAKELPFIDVTRLCVIKKKQTKCVFIHLISFSAQLKYEV